MSDDEGFNVREAVDKSAEAVAEFTTTLLGTQKELYTCPDCNVACEEATTHNPQTAAFDGGACPSWECPECGSHYIREADDSAYSLDLYGRG